MTLATFFALQLAEIRKVDGTLLDDQVRRRRFKDAKGDRRAAYPADVYPTKLDGADLIKYGYRRSRILYE